MEWCTLERCTSQCEVTCTLSDVWDDRICDIYQEWYAAWVALRWQTGRRQLKLFSGEAVSNRCLHLSLALLSLELYWTSSFLVIFWAHRNSIPQIPHLCPLKLLGKSPNTLIFASSSYLVIRVGKPITHSSLSTRPLKIFGLWEMRKVTRSYYSLHILLGIKDRRHQRQNISP